MATISLNVSEREATGKGGARKVRASGNIPGVVYRAGNVATPITLDPHALELGFKRTGNPNTLVDLDMGGTKRTCLVRDVQRHPVTKTLRHVDFYEVDPNESVTVQVPVKTTGIAAGIKLGGTLRVVKRFLSVRCKPDDIPDALTIDITKMVVGDMVRVSGIPAPDNCEILYNFDFNVLGVIGKRGGELDEDEDEDEEGEGEGTAEGSEGSES